MANEVLEMVRKAREAYGERFCFDIGAMCRDLREREVVGGREVVSLPSRRIVRVTDVPPDLADVDPGSGLTSTAVTGS